MSTSVSLSIVFFGFAIQYHKFQLSLHIADSTMRSLSISPLLTSIDQYNQQLILYSQSKNNSIIALTNKPKISNNFQYSFLYDWLKQMQLSEKIKEEIVWTSGRTKLQVNKCFSRSKPHPFALIRYKYKNTNTNTNTNTKIKRAAGHLDCSNCSASSRHSFPLYRRPSNTKYKYK